jgi:aminopeptidase N
MRRLPSIILGLGLAVAPLGARDTYPRQPGIKVQHYVFALTLSDSTDEIAGEASVTIHFEKDGLASFFLDLASAANGKGMTVTGVTSDGKTVSYAHEKSRLTIRLGTPSHSGEWRRFTVRYHGVPADGLRTGVNKYGERCFFSWNWPDKAREWLPMIDHPSAKATSEFVVTAPLKYAVVANGLLQEETLLGDGRKLTHWKQSVPIASWLNAIGVAEFAVHHGGMVKGVELQTWVSHQELDAGVARFEATARRSIEFFSEAIGPYSYEKMASVTAPFNGGATEHASEVYYGDGGTWNLAPAPAAARAGGAGGRAAGAGGRAGGRGGAPTAVIGASGGGAGGVIAHEIAHQWFGDAVTESDWDDAWLSEGFATYFTLLYDEHYVGHDQFIAGVKAMFQRARAAEEQSHLPLVHENIDDLAGVIPQLVYQKGGSVLQMLRGQVGTEDFWKAIREYYRRHQNGNASSDDLRRAFEETTGQELQWFFSQWLHGTTTPALEGEWSYDSAAKKIVIELAQTQPGKPFRLPLEIAIVPDTTGAQARPAIRMEKIELNSARQRFEIAADRAPRDVQLDPNSWVMMDPPKFAARR